MSHHAIRRTSVEELLVWQADQDKLYELVDGVPVAMAGAKVRHDRITANALRQIGNQLRAAHSPCERSLMTSAYRLRQAGFVGRL